MIYKCTISMLPIHAGDGYGWGGDVILTIEGVDDDAWSLNLGTSDLAYKRAQIIHDAIFNYHSTPDNRR